MHDDPIKQRRPIGKIVIACSVAGALLGFGTCGAAVANGIGGYSPRADFFATAGAWVCGLSLIGVVVGVVLAVRED